MKRLLGIQRYVSLDALATSHRNRSGILRICRLGIERGGISHVKRGSRFLLIFIGLRMRRCLGIPGPTGDGQVVVARIDASEFVHTPVICAHRLSQHSGAYPRPVLVFEQSHLRPPDRIAAFIRDHAGDHRLGNHLKDEPFRSEPRPHDNRGGKIIVLLVSLRQVSGLARREPVFSFRQAVKCEQSVISCLHGERRTMAIRSFDPHGATSKQRAAERIDNFAINAPGSGAGPGRLLRPRSQNQRKHQ